MRVSLCISAVAVLHFCVPAGIEAQPPASIADRARGAERVLVASVADVAATLETNEFGDRLIVSHVKLQIEESLKGGAVESIEIDVDGGTVGDLTLEVSSLPRIARGERAVFFVTQNKHGKYVPHLRGQGILKLDSENRVKGTSLDLATIRQAAASAAAR